MRCARVIFCVGFLVVVFADYSCGQQLADSFQPPLDDYQGHVLLGFGQRNPYFGNKPHTGEDVGWNQTGARVRAIGNGKIVYSGPSSSHPCDGGWGWVTIAIHNTSYGLLTSVSGHIESSHERIGPSEKIKEKTIAKGDLVGTIANYSCSSKNEIKTWLPHLHFAIFNGVFSFNRDGYPNELNGYMADSSFPGNYLKASAFVACESSPSNSLTWDFVPTRYDRVEDRAQFLSHSQCWNVREGARTNGFGEPGWIVDVAQDPQLISPPVTIDSARVAAIEFRMASTVPQLNGEEENRFAEIFFDDTGGGFTSSKVSQRHFVLGNGAYSSYTFNLPTNLGTIRRIRVDPVVSGRPRGTSGFAETFVGIGIDYIKLLPRTTTTASIALRPGWNLISLPIQPAHTNIQTVLGSIAGKFRSVWGWDGGILDFRSFHPDRPDLSDLSVIEAGRGYWINMAVAGTLVIEGVSPSRTVSLRRGANLVGFTGSSRMPIQQALSTILDKVIGVWSYDSSYGFRVFIPGSLGFLSDLDAMEPGQGYWIHTTDSATWTLP